MMREYFISKESFQCCRRSYTVNIADCFTKLTSWPCIAAVHFSGSTPSDKSLGTTRPPGHAHLQEVLLLAALSAWLSEKVTGRWVTPGRKQVILSLENLVDAIKELIAYRNLLRSHSGPVDYIPPSLIQIFARCIANVYKRFELFIVSCSCKSDG